MPGPAKWSLSEEDDFFPIRQPMNLMLGFSKFLPVKTRPSRVVGFLRPHHD